MRGATPGRNPYLAAWRRQRANRRRTLGLGAVLPGLLGPVVATLILIPLVRPVFLSFLALPADRWGEGMEAVLLRAGAVIIGWLSLDVYTAVIRGPDREVLSLLPVDPGAVVRFQVAKVAAERWWLLPAAAALLSPVALAGAPGLWAAGLVVLLGSWAMGLVVSAATHLLAVEVAESERWAPVLDLVRGHNPRPQAAFLYAPGFVLIVCGLVLAQGARGAVLASAGDPLGWVLVLLPVPLVVVAAGRLGTLAAGSWFRGSAVLAEIDARYATVGDREDALRVYLDWTVRWLPGRVATYALKDLRHGWRARRSLITGAWLVGLAAFVAGWTADPVGAVRAATVAIFGVWLVASLGVLLERDEPEFLTAWLPPGGTPAGLARAWVLGLWVLPCFVVGALAVLLRRGLTEAGTVVAVGLICAAVAVPVAMACARLKGRGLVVYAPVATVAAAAIAAAMGGMG